MSEERDDIVVLVDEDGVETEFEVLDIIEYEGDNYVVMLPAEESEDEAEDDGVVTIMRIEAGEDDEDILVPVESEAVLDNVFDIFKENMADEFDFEE